MLRISSVRSKSKIMGIALLLFALLHCTQAHHSYVMFDGSTLRTVSGTVAKIEWTNPHVYLWMYVPSAQQAGKYDLYAFENGSPNAITKAGWSKESLPFGEKITAEYWPLRDGRNGGHLAVVTFADGRKLRAVGGLGVKPTATNAPTPVNHKP